MRALHQMSTEICQCSSQSGIHWDKDTVLIGHFLDGKEVTLTAADSKQIGAE